MIEIAKKINRKGDLYIKKNGIKDFHLVASELLSESNLADQFDFQKVVEHTFNSKNVQHFKNLEFSDLPITIAHSENCFIDLYFWRRRPTVVHNHHFTGAFMCLLGQNVDLEFSFHKKQKLGRFHDLGDLKLMNSRRIGPGDIAPIAFMDKFIHQNHHHCDLSVNLCFRTSQYPGKNLSNYLFSGLRYEKEPELLGQVERLMRFIAIGDFDFSKINISHDQAINFLIQSYDLSSENPRFIKLQNLLRKKVKNELGIDVMNLMKKHNETFDKMLEDYE